MAERLAGDAKVAIKDGVVDGFDLPAINQQLAHLENIGNILALGQAAGCRAARPDFRRSPPPPAANGTVTTDRRQAVRRGGTATAEAAVDLVPVTLQSHVQLQRWPTAMPRHWACAAKAPWTPPGKIIDINDLQRWLAERGLGRAVKAKANGRDVLQQLLPRAFATGDQLPCTPAPGPIKPASSAGPKSSRCGRIAQLVEQLESSISGPKVRVLVRPPKFGGK